jgi:tetratricopeptide (TPR) repeat protein
VASQSDIDRLIELGLNRYGAGDLDGALLVWEEVLAIDPDNAKANSYVDYVRLNYELLTNAQPVVTDEEGFAISEEPEYQIEVEAVELRRAETVPSKPSNLDEGWSMDDEERPPQADENFEDATREYHNATPRPSSAPPASDFAAEPSTSEFQQSEVTGGFQPEPTPISFANQETEVRKRDFGFVKVAPPPTDAPQPVQDTPSSPLSLGNAPTRDIGAAVETQEIPIMKARTRPLPSPSRPPARRDAEALSQAEVMLPHAPTQDFQGTPRVDISAPTRELGLRPPSKPLANPPEMERPGFTGDDEDVPTKQSDARAIREAASRRQGIAPTVEGTRHDIVLPFDPIDARTAQILGEVDENAPPDEPKEEQTRRRISSLLQRAIEYNTAGEADKAVAAVDLALSEDPNSALGQKLVTRNRDTIMQIFQSFIGDLDRMPQLARPLHELSNAPISPRAAFLLSRIDGTLTIDELLDVSGMPRMEAYRHLCQLFLRGILR